MVFSGTTKDLESSCIACLESILPPGATSRATFPKASSHAESCGNDLIAFERLSGMHRAGIRVQDRPLDNRNFDGSELDVTSPPALTDER